jgi:4-hydroxybenzoate polyprenyltransferase
LSGATRSVLGRGLSLVKFSHSVFALPFALASAWVAAGGLPPLEKLLWIVLAAVAARTAAMAFNRLVDRRIDAANPRTQQRELVTGALSPGFARALVLGASLVFVAAAGALGPWCLALSPLVLAVLLGYSYAKRFWSGAHLWLGTALALAPLGAWLAVRGDFSGPLGAPISLAGAVALWVAGFDLIYACQDADFDARGGLHSVPGRYGVAMALLLARVCHALALLLLGFFALAAGLSPWFLAVLLAIAGLLIAQHRLVSPGDLSRVDLAFFTLNGWVAVGFFVGVALDLALQAPGGPA